MLDTKKIIMKRYINKFLALGAALLLFAACEEEAVLTVLEEVNFSASPEASANAVTLTEENAGESVLSVNWPAVEYPVDAPVTYSLQVALPADTVGNATWSNSYEKEIGEDVLSASFPGEELNDIAKNLGVEPGTAGTVVVRVKAYLDRAVFSEPVAVSVTPYEVFVSHPALWVAGDFQGWDVTTAPTIVSVNDDGVYEGYIYIPEGGTNEFKLYAQPDWGPVSYGTEEEGVLIEANYAGANFSVPSAGYYLFVVDLNSMTYLLMETNWGLIGGATPGGWDSDTEMTYNPETQTWSVTADMKAEGSFKFRANNEWVLDFGVDEEGNLAYANHPLLEYVERPQLTVPEDGNYTITLDLHEAGNYTYSIERN
jgi:hypothetical protein